LARLWVLDRLAAKQETPVDRTIHEEGERLGAAFDEEPLKVPLSALQAGYARAIARVRPPGGGDDHTSRSPTGPRVVEGTSVKEYDVDCNDNRWIDCGNIDSSSYGHVAYLFPHKVQCRDPGGYVEMYTGLRVYEPDPSTKDFERLWRTVCEPSLAPVPPPPTPERPTPLLNRVPRTDQSAPAQTAPAQAVPAQAVPSSSFPTCAGGLDDWCAKVKLPSSVAVCSDPELRSLMIERQKAFDEAKSRLAPGRQKALLADQNGWVKTYPQACGISLGAAPPLPLSPAIKDCMATAGRARIAYLQACAREPAPAMATSPAPEAPATSTSQPAAATRAGYGPSDIYRPPAPGPIAAKCFVVYPAQPPADCFGR
jgi:uncharacterized protein